MSRYSGQFIDGTGEYNLYQTTPPIESGQLSSIANQNINEGVFEVFEQESIYTSGRWYRIRFNVTSFTSGAFKMRWGSDPYFTNETGNSTGEFEFISLCSNATLQLVAWTSGYVASISNFTVEEVPEGYPVLEEGDIVAECTSAGTFIFPSSRFTGTWEFDILSAQTTETRVIPISNKISIDNGYIFEISTGERIVLWETTSAAETLLARTALSYIRENIWYRIKIERNINGDFSIYIKGGDFGVDDWTLVTMDSGTNPVNDDTHNKSNYFIISFGVGDKIANIKILNEIV
jgi:hypothetical protein